MDFNLDLSDLAAELEAMARTLENIEQGLGADGVGHGLRLPVLPDPDAQDGR